MIKTEISFFYFAGLIIGGIAFLGNSLLAISFAFGGLGSILSEYIASAWEAVYLLSISFMTGAGLSDLSIRLFYYRFTSSEKVKRFHQEIEKQLGINPSVSENYQGLNFKSQFITHLAYAHNVGHPNSLYDMASRARLAGTACLNACWASVLSISLTVWKLISSGFSTISLAMVALSIFLLVSIRPLLRFTQQAWMGYAKRQAVFSVFQYVDGTLKYSSVLNDFFQESRTSTSEVSKD